MTVKWQNTFWIYLKGWSLLQRLLHIEEKKWSLISLTSVKTFSERSFKGNMFWKELLVLRGFFGPEEFLTRNTRVGEQTHTLSTCKQPEKDSQSQVQIPDLHDLRCNFYFKYL